MATAYEPSGNALALTLSLRADPCTTLGPDRSVTLSCFVACAAQVPPDARPVPYLRFVLPPEAVVTPADTAAIELRALVPGKTHRFERAVRIHPGVTDGSMLQFEVVIYDDDGRLYRSNVISLNVRRKARLRGPQTFVRIEPTGIAREIRIIAQVYNHGDGSAENITLEVPPPSGTQVADLRTKTFRTFTRIAANASSGFEYIAYVSASDRTNVNVSDAVLRDASGLSVRLTPASIELRAAFAPPELTVERIGRRLHARIHGTNDGAGAARDVTFALRWPHGFACNRASLEYNGARVGCFERLQAVARANVEPDAATIIVAAIDAGAHYVLEFDLYPDADVSDGCLDLALHAASAVTNARAELRWASPARLALRVAGEPDCAVYAGSRASIDLELANGGDRDLDVCIIIAGMQADLHVAGALIEGGQTVRIAAGERLELNARLNVPHVIVAQCLTVTFIAGDASQELARSTSLIRIRPTGPDGLPEWAGPQPDLTAGAASTASQPARPFDDAPPCIEPARTSDPAVPAAPRASIANEAADVRFIVEMTTARIERCLRLLQAAVPLTVAGHVCALRAFLPAVARNADAIVATRLRAVHDGYEAALERLALRLRMPGPNVTDQHADHATHALTIALFEHIAAGTQPNAPEVQEPNDRQSPAPTVLGLSFSRAQAQRQLDLLRAEFPPGINRSSLALMPHASTRDVGIGAALEAYVEALRAADPTVRGVALERIDTKRRALVNALNDAWQTTREQPGAIGDNDHIVAHE